MFIEDNRGNFIPLSRITIGGSRQKEADTAEKQGRSVCRGWFKTTDDPEYQSYCDIDFSRQLARIPLQLIPCEPNTEIVFWHWHKDKLNLWTNPCIAWSLCADAEIRPVEIEGVVTADDWAIKLPNGSVVCPWDRTCPNLEDFRTSLVEDRAEKTSAA